MTTTAKVRRLSLCATCQFPFLDESISLGAEYVLHGPGGQHYRFICGGCGTLNDAGQCVLAASIRYPDQEPRELPLALFGGADPRLQ